MNANDTLQTKEVAETLGLHEKVGRRLVIRTLGVLALIAAVCVALIVLHGRKMRRQPYTTKPIR